MNVEFTFTQNIPIRLRKENFTDVLQHQGLAELLRHRGNKETVAAFKQYVKHTS